MFIEQSHDEVYGCLKGGSGNSGGKILAISMVEEAWLSEKEEERIIKTKGRKNDQKPTRNGEDKKKSEDGKPNQSKDT
ncbi:hypothetical protein Tco_0435509, partial [Tanacetum coccineum]